MGSIAINMKGHYLWLPFLYREPGPYDFMTANDIVFFKLRVNGGERCGLTMVKFTGTLVAIGDYYAVVFPVGDIEMALVIPWFIWP